MFDFRAEDDGFTAWVDRWRAYRGIDRWPIVPAKIIGKAWIEGSEGGGYYELSLEYRVPSSIEAGRLLTVVTKSVNPGSPGSEMEIGDSIQLHAHPEKINKVAFADTTESARTLSIVILLLSLLIAFGAVKGCQYIDSDAPPSHSR